MERVADTKLQALGAFDEPPDIESIETKAPSYNGTLIPLSLIFKRGTKLDGSHPTLLSGYGAYAITIDPYFSPRSLAWLEKVRCGFVRLACISQLGIIEKSAQSFPFHS